MSASGGSLRNTCRSDTFRVTVSDVCQLVAILLLLVSVAVGTVSPKPSYSWVRGYLNVPYTDGSIHTMTVNFGLTNYVQCVNDVPPGSDFYGCNTFDLGDIQNSSCKVAGQGVIAAATFACLFGLLSIFFLHSEVNGKSAFGYRVPFPRLILNIASFISFLLYIVVVATWFEKCVNGANSITWFPTTGAHQNLKDCYAGYAVATAIIAVFFSFVSYFFAFWRTCSPNKTEASGKQPTVQVGTGTSQAALAGAVAWNVAPHVTPANIATVAAGAQVARQYGTAYSNYASPYENNEPPPAAAATSDPAEGTTRGGYGGGSYGGAYGGNETRGGYTNGGYGY